MRPATEGNTLNFTVTLSPAPTQSVTYYYATYQDTARGGGQDYRGHYATALTFSSGADEQNHFRLDHRRYGRRVGRTVLCLHYGLLQQASEQRDTE